MTRSSWRPAGLVLASSTSLQVGLAVAANAFDEAGPMGAVWIRSLVGAGLLALYIRPDLRVFTREQVIAVGAYAMALTGLTGFAYLAVAQAPLGVVSAILMLGPLGIAAWGHRAPLDLVFVGIATTGVLVLSLTGDVSGRVEPTGILFALAGAGSFALYIVFGKLVSQRVEGLSGLALALIIVALLQTPMGLILGRPGIWDPNVLVALAVAGVMSTLIPFALEMTALRTLSMATFGLLLAFEPAIAALAGAVIRADTLSVVQVAGIALVIAAGAGVLGPRGWMRRLGSYNRELMTDPKVQALSRVPLFGGLSARDLSAIADVAIERHAAPGEVLTEQGTAGDAFFVIADGAISITQDGRELRRLGPGDYLGEIALVFGGLRTATATVTTEANLFVLGVDAFNEMLKRQPRLEDKILTTVSERMRYR